MTLSKGFLVCLAVILAPTLNIFSETLSLETLRIEGSYTTTIFYVDQRSKRIEWAIRDAVAKDISIGRFIVTDEINWTQSLFEYLSGFRDSADANTRRRFKDALDVGNISNILETSRSIITYDTSLGISRADYAYYQAQREQGFQTTVDVVVKKQGMSYAVFFNVGGRLREFAAIDFDTQSIGLIEFDKYADPSDSILAIYKGFESRVSHDLYTDPPHSFIGDTYRFESERTLSSIDIVVGAIEGIEKPGLLFVTHYNPGSRDSNSGPTFINYYYLEAK